MGLGSICPILRAPSLKAAPADLGSSSFARVWEVLSFLDRGWYPLLQQYRMAHKSSARRSMPMTMPAMAPPSRPLGAPPPPPPPPSTVVLVPLLLLCPPVVFKALGDWVEEKVVALDKVGLDKGDHCGEFEAEAEKVSKDTVRGGEVGDADEEDVEVVASVIASDGKAVKLAAMLRAGLGE